MFFRSWDSFLKLNMTICVLSELLGAHPKDMELSGNIWNMPETLEEATLYLWQEWCHRLIRNKIHRNVHILLIVMITGVID